jgi:hypothetical protein
VPTAGGVAFRQGAISTEARLADEDKRLPAMRWLLQSDLETEGLSSSVRKITKLVQSATQKEKASIKRFCKAKPVVEACTDVCDEL